MGLGSGPGSAGPHCRQDLPGRASVETERLVSPSGFSSSASGAPRNFRIPPLHAGQPQGPGSNLVATTPPPPTCNNPHTRHELASRQCHIPYAKSMCACGFASRQSRIPPAKPTEAQEAAPNAAHCMRSARH
eukprot:265554-Chlamydomonas_euryale.AAC.1